MSSKSNLIYRCAPSTKDEEQEQLDMVLRQTLLDSSSTSIVTRNVTTSAHTATNTTISNHSIPSIAAPFLFDQQIPIPMFPYYFINNQLPFTYPNVPLTFQPEQYKAGPQIEPMALFNKYSRPKQIIVMNSILV